MKLTGLAPPSELYIMITSGCNLQCRHCWPQAVATPAAESMALPEFRTLIDHFIDLGISSVCITGGEPLTHPEVEDMLAYAVSKTALVHVCLQTNGVLLTDDRLVRLLEISKEKIRFQISLEGASPQTNDAIRGQGGFDLAVSGLRRIQALGLGRLVTIAFTETAVTIADLPELLALAEQLEAGRLVSGCLVMKGRAGRHPDLELPRPEQYTALLELYCNDNRFRERYDRLGNFAAIEWYKGRSYPRDDSCQCMTTPYVNAAGDLFPCHMLPWDRWRIREAAKRPFEDVLTEISARWTDIRCSFSQGRPKPEMCRTCPGEDHCGGGCLGRVTGDEEQWAGVEDRCELRKTVYSWNEKK